MLSKLNGSKGAVGAETYANRTCLAPPSFASVDEVLAADKSLLDANKAPLQTFSLPAQNDHTVQDRQIRDSISGLEDQLGYKLNYCWFDDDSGKAQVFLLGKAEKETEAPAPPVASCVPFENLVDDSANLQLNIPNNKERNCR